MKIEIETNTICFELPIFGREFTIGDNILYKETVTASGKTVRDIITKKKQFVIEYSLIEQWAIDLLLQVQAEEITLKVTINNNTTNYKVLMESFERKRMLITSNTTYWSNVTIVLKEI